MKTPEVDTDNNRLDFEFIFNAISNTYWAKGRSREIMKKCIDNSFNFGLYLGSNQIGYARVVTDFAQFAYLMDVYIDPNHRGKSYSILLLDKIFNHEKLINVLTWRLASSDARGLYEKYGFKPLSKPETLMERFKMAQEENSK
jgi:hypothetical protein